MAKSILTNKKECFICKTTFNLEEHHIFKGALRKTSERYGLKVWLCHEHHQGKEGVHGKNRWLDCYLKKLAQERFEIVYPDLDFMELFHKRYK